MHEISALLLIAKTVGRPLFVDKAMANGSQSSVARVCLEYDCRQPPVEQVWIVVQNRETGAVIRGYSQCVEFLRMPDYCSHYCHVGHSESVCLVMGNKPVKLGNNNAPPFGQSKLANKGTRVQIRELTTVLNDQNPSNEEPMSKIDKRKSIVLEEPPKQGKEWQVVRQSGKSGTKNSKGVKITLEESKDV